MSEVKHLHKITLSSFEIIFKQYYNELCLYALKIIGDDAIAEEMVQALFCNLWYKRGELNFEKNIKNYLYRAVRNNCLMWCRKNRNKFSVSIEDVENSLVTNENSLDYLETNEAVENAINQLSPRVKQIFLLIRYDGLKYKEAAEKLSVSVKTIEKAMGQALKMLRLSLLDYIVSVIIILNLIIR